MNRRSFLKRLGLGVAGAAATVAVAPLLTKVAVPKTFTGTFEGLDVIKTTPALDAATIRMLRQSLIARNVYPGQHGTFRGSIHPFVLRDLKVAEYPGWVSYKFTLKATARPNTAQRLRYIDMPNLKQVAEGKKYRTYILGKDAVSL